MSKVSASTFRDPLLKVLGQLTGLVAGTDVPYGDTIQPVLDELGYTEAQFGNDSVGRPQVHVWINQAFNKKLREDGLGRKGSKKGQWTLTDTGVKAAALLMGGTTPEESPVEDDDFDSILASVEPATEQAAVASVASEDEESEDEESEDEESEDEESAAPAPPGGYGVSFSLGEQVNSYNPDPYIRGLAIEQTECFGQFSARSAKCETCPLSGACKATSLERLGSIAALLRKRDEEAARRAKEPLMAPDPDPVGPKFDDDDLDIEDIIAAIEDEEPKADPNITFMDSIPADTVCTTCGVTLKAGESAYWHKAGGMHHPKCWKK